MGVHRLAHPLRRVAAHLNGHRWKRLHRHMRGLRAGAAYLAMQPSSGVKFRSWELKGQVVVRKLLNSVIVLIFFTATARSNEISASEFIEKYKNSSQFADLVTGAGEAYGWVNVVNRGKGLPVLYCPPSKLALTSDQYIAILESHVRDKRADGDLPGHAVLLVLLNALEATFPCN